MPAVSSNPVSSSNPISSSNPAASSKSPAASVLFAAFVCALAAASLPASSAQAAGADNWRESLFQFKSDWRACGSIPDPMSKSRCYQQTMDARQAELSAWRASIPAPPPGVGPTVRDREMEARQLGCRAMAYGAAKASCYESLGIN